MKRSRRAFTLVEFLIFAAVFAVVTIGLVTALVAVLHVQTEESTAIEAKTQGQFLVQQLQYYVQSARLVDMAQDVATSTLKLRETAASSSLDPTTITLASGTMYLTQGASGVPQPLTSNKVAVTNLSFTRHYNLNNSSTAYGADSVSYSFTVGTSASNTTKQYFQTFQSSVAVLSPVPKIALVQQANTVAYGTSTSMALPYGSGNATGSLLLAVVANTNLVNVSSSDSAGNAWTQLASTSYALYGQEVTILGALNAKSGSNTVTVSLGGSGGYNPSVFLYEYRGAATSSSFDAFAAATSTANTMISGGAANPTSTAELVLGVLNLTAAAASPPVAGAGFVLESSSSVSNTYVEDQDVYVTGPVAATWTVSPAATATALVATFR